MGNLVPIVAFHHGRFYVSFTVDGETKRTGIAIASDSRVSWDEDFHFSMLRYYRRVPNFPQSAKPLQVLPYAKCAFTVLTFAQQAVIVQKERDNRFRHLVKVISGVFSFLTELKAGALERHTKTIKVLTLQTTECGYFIRDYTKQKSFRGAHFNIEKQCLTGTREALLEKILTWIIQNDDEGPRVLVLAGVPGTGKSTVAHTVVKQFHELKWFRSSFFSTLNIQSVVMTNSSTQLPMISQISTLSGSML
ncbi:hypothetical protein B0H10DRAFT_1955895 [Mycena sp. CBHHK59/15]|nr:hypothetical protein B0H10DRAFT_1955895 [Mycena sp. CBHHK59/15]